MGLLFLRLPTAFLPDEDQGYLFTLVQTPVGSTMERTERALDKIEDYFVNHEQDAVKSVFTVAGFSFSGSGQNAGIGFVLLRDWSERKSPEAGCSGVPRPRLRRADADQGRDGICVCASAGE